MRGFIFVLVVGAGIVGLGFFLGWFHVGSDTTDGKQNVTLSVDTDKFQEDRKSAVANVQDLGRQIKDKVAGSSERTMDGTIVGVKGDQLTMTNKDGKEHSHALAADVRTTCDGKACTTGDLKAGTRIRVTTNEAAPHGVARIEALDKDAAFANISHDGKVVSITGTKLVMTNLEGKSEQTCTLKNDAAITCDGKVCKAADIKPGMRVRVTTENAEPHAATRIEALDTDRDFEKGI